MTHEYMSEHATSNQTQPEFDDKTENQGILSMYNRKHNLTAEQVMTQDFREQRQKLEQGLAESSDPQGTTGQMIEQTKNLLGNLNTA